MSFLYMFRILLAALYLIAISVLFFLPGSAFPQKSWMNTIWFDKWVHIGFFMLLISLWCWALALTEKNAFITLLIVAAAYGILVEIVQDQFIANRSFDLGDWVADMIGSSIGLWGWTSLYKKIDPCGNRGRNQN